MERDDRAAVASFLVADVSLVPGTTVGLGDDLGHHVRVRRLSVGVPIALLDGHGHRALGTLVRTAPSFAVEIESLDVASPMPPVHLLLPIADKDRMLLLAEKATELGVSSWRPVLYRRSRSVKPRGEGPTFNGKVKTRMAAALEQSAGRWLPVMYPESTLALTLAALPPHGARVVLDAEAPPLLRLGVAAPVTIAVGPEGGFEPDELQALADSGFQRTSVAEDILRFETAAVAGIVIARSLLRDHV